MSLRMHRILMHVVYLLGMVGGFFCFAIGCSAVMQLLDLPAPLYSSLSVPVLKPRSDFLTL
jgi:hypothetical protein